MLTIANLPKETEAEIQRLIDTGEYADGAAVVVQAVHRLAAEREQVTHLRSLLQEGLDDLEQGRVVEWSPELSDQLWEEAKRRHALGEQPSPDVCP